MSTQKKITIFAGWACVVVIISLGFAVEIVQIDCTSKAGCFCTMKQIAGAKDTWMNDQHKSLSDRPTWAELVGPDLYLREIPSCPHGGIYIIGRVCEAPICSIPEDTAYYRKHMHPRCPEDLNGTNSSELSDIKMKAEHATGDRGPQ